jgi:hypothetical protein
VSDVPRPLLILPQARRTSRDRRFGRPGTIELPSAARQGQRLAPAFAELQRAFAEKRAALRSDVAGAEPEKVLVLEIVGLVEDFVRAVQRVEGLEWLAEVDDSFEQDDDFYVEGRDESRPLSGQLFLVMSDQRAFEELLALWEQYVRDPDASFDYGLGRWKRVFERLRAIRPWDSRDRLDRTYILRDWRERVRAGQETIRTEVELWFRRDNDRRSRARDVVDRLVREEGGRLLDEAVIPEILYHAVLAELPITSVETILQTREALLVRTDDVMLFRPVGQATLPGPEDEPVDRDVDRASAQRESRGAPTVALLDGLPLENHALLRGRLTIDDPDDWGSTYPANERHHGTAMASLIVHGELDADEAALSRPLYVRPILRPDRRDWRAERSETVPEDLLFVDLVYRSVRRLFEGEGSEPAVAPSVRVINLSVCDTSLPFDRALSPIARLLDWLSWRYGVLFVVSAGNHAHDLVLSASPAALDAMTAQELEDLTLETLSMDIHRRRVLAPGESVNALTIGSAHDDLSTPLPGSPLRNLIATRDAPSPISSAGLGFRRSIKPDVLFPGGRQLYRDVGTDSGACTVGPVVSSQPPGQLVASPGRPGDESSVRYTRGTSNAAATASRAASIILDEVVRGVLAEGLPEGSPQRDAAALKALVVHSASWGASRGRFEALLRFRLGTRRYRELAARLLGYGVCDPVRSISCTPQRVTLLGVGALRDGQADVYEVPMPPSLSGEGVWRRLAVTVAWMTPTNPDHRLYRRAHLWFDPPRDDLQVARSEVDWQAVQRGTVQHEVLEGDAAAAFADGDALAITVNCRADAGSLPEDVPYALVVTLEIAPEIRLPIYDEVAARVRARVPVQPRPT